LPQTHTNFFKFSYMNLKYNKAIAEAAWIASSQVLLAMTPPPHFPPQITPKSLSPLLRKTTEKTRSSAPRTLMATV